MSAQPSSKAKDAVRFMRELENSSDQAVSWMRPGGICCLGPRRYGYCANPHCVRRAIYASGLHARNAARAAMRLFPFLLPPKAVKHG